MSIRTSTARAAAIMCSAALAVSLAACGSDGDDASGATGSKKTYTIGISNPIGSNPTLKNWQKGIEVQAKSLGMKTVVADANFDPNKQLSDVRSLADQGVDALIVHPLNPAAIRAAVEQASSKGITVVGYDGGEGPYKTNFLEQGYEAAKASAIDLGKRIGSGKKIAVLQGVPQVPILAARNKGFEDGAKEAGLQIIVKEVNLKDTAAGAQPLVEGWRSKYGDEIAGILAYNDPTALGAAAAKRSGFSPVINGMNASSEGIAGVKDGQIASTFDQRSAEVGNGLAFAAKQLLDGETVPATVNVVMTHYDESNVADWTAPEELAKSPLTVEFVEQSGTTVLKTSAGK